MDSLLIISPDGTCKELVLETGVLSIGADASNDVVLPIRGFVTFIKQGQSTHAKNSGDVKGKGDWGKELKDSTVLSYDGHTFIYVPQVLIQRSKLKDWDASKLPKNATKASYPDELLDFLLDMMGADQGAILLLDQRMLRTLASKKIQLRDQAEIFLQRLLEGHADESVINMNYNTHTLLFQAGLTPLDFCLIQHPISEAEKIVLYLPRTKAMKDIPEGMLLTMLGLCAGNVTSHLLHKRHKHALGQQGSVEHGFFWGQSQKMASLKSYVDKLAKTNLSILIQGETGSGKEMLVKYLKQKSTMTNVVSVNCAAIPKELAESVLFGHKKGSFTGAHADQIGKIQEAHRGILFLDEIGELDLNVQAKLLRVLQEGKLTPIGGQEVGVSFWAIAATHRDLEAMIKAGQFREDLFFRLNEASVKIPSLAERDQDIPAMATYFVEEVVNNNGLERKVLSKDALDFLQARTWRGNGRELRAFIRKAVLLTEGEIIDMSALRASGNVGTDRPVSIPDDLQTAKRIFVGAHIERVLERHRGNKTHAAKALGITTRNLYRLIDPDQNDLPH
jgi:DNA-binding NtrC family response regulator